MCDDFTEAALPAAASGGGLSRRSFGALGVAGALGGCAAMPSDDASGAVNSRMVSFATADGEAQGFYAAPSRGKHPGIILWPDIAGLREAKQAMALRLASAGYAVLAVNHYYRSARAPLFDSFAQWRTPEGRERIAPMAALLTPAAIARDVVAYAGFLDAQAQVTTRRGIGTMGYCMGGPFAVRSAIALPGRIGAAASFHGGGLVTEAADSPHRLLSQARASFLIAVAQNDDARAPADKDQFRLAASAARRPAEVEVYAADHGWCVPDSPAFNKAEADRAWTRMLALYATL